ncbi:MAG TPA: geranylgeranyl reductase family protein [Actinomycetota bacterium]|nr:geranylgeranyl reductase family protein [Actinomycetota bacterium]
MSDCDVVVVGGGPGGSSAAYFLARAGARVVMLEKKAFPRSKTCGDGLTPRAVAVLREIGMQPELETYHRAGGIRILATRRELELPFPKASTAPDFALVRPRKDFDAELARRAQDAGAELRTRTEAVAPHMEGSRVAGVRWVRKEPAEGGGVVKADEGILRAPFVVVADGASSSLGRALGIARRPDTPLGLAVRTYYESDRTNDGYLEAWLEVRKDGKMLPGYGWLFPVGDGTVNVGVGLLATTRRAQKINLNDLQRAFIDGLPKSYGISHDGQVGPYKSGRLPLGWNVPKPYGPGYIAIGDAAGVINPLTGEGIAYAMETGKIAAGLIAGALADGSSSELSAYREALRDTYAGYYRLGLDFLRLISHPRTFETLTSIGMRSKKWMTFLVQVMVNVAETRGGGPGDRAFRAAVRLYERRLEDLPDPVIPVPPTVGRRADNGSANGSANGARKRPSEPQPPKEAPVP